MDPDLHYRNEMDDAAHYVRDLLPEKIHSPLLKTDWAFIPSHSLGGDAFGYEWLDQDHFCFYLLDASGHGVSAALHSVSVLNVMKNKSFGNGDPLKPSSVLKALNQAYLMETHHNLFFTLWYGVLNTANHTLTFSSGGHPPALLLTKEKTLKLSTDGVALGAQAKSTYKDHKLKLPPASTLLLFSDGIYEIPKGDGRLSYEEFVELAVAKNGDIASLIRETTGYPPLDDISILKLTITASR